MGPDAGSDANELAAAASHGDARAAAKLMTLVYEELHALAARHLRHERPDHTLQPTALVHEAYLRLAGQDRVDWQGKTHFRAVAAIAMRRVLVDHARARAAVKRGQGVQRITLSDSIGVSQGEIIDLMTIQEVLTKLEAKDAETARIVELRFFGDLSEPEIAQYLGISERTVRRRWAWGRAWLRAKLALE